MLKASSREMKVAKKKKNNTPLKGQVEVRKCLLIWKKFSLLSNKKTTAKQNVFSTYMNFSIMLSIVQTFCYNLLSN